MYLSYTHNNNNNKTGTATFSESKATTEMYVFGGIDMKYIPFQEFWMFDVSKKKWTDLTETTMKDKTKSPSARWMASFTPIKGGQELFLFGGCSETGGPLDDAWRYKVKDKKWELVSSTQSRPPNARWLHSALSVLSGGSLVKEYVVVFGGSANNIHYNDMYMYDVSENIWFEDYPSSDLPMARDGHSMVLLASPEMRETMKKATKKAASAKTKSRRRLLGLEDLPFVQTPIDYAKLKEEKKEPPYNPVEKAASDATAQATDFVANQRSSKNNVWFLVFGGRGERGEVVSSSTSTATLY